MGDLVQSNHGYYSKVQHIRLQELNIILVSFHPCRIFAIYFNLINDILGGSLEAMLHDVCMKSLKCDYLKICRSHLIMTKLTLIMTGSSHHISIYSLCRFATGFLPNSYSITSLVCWEVIRRITNWNPFALMGNQSIILRYPACSMFNKYTSYHVWYGNDAF